MLQDMRDKLEDKAAELWDKLVEKAGGERRAAIAGIGGAAGAVLIIALVVALVPKAPVAPPAAPTEDLGEGVSAAERVQEAEEDAEPAVPDEAKTVRELAQERVVEAKLVEMTDATHMTCTLVNGDTVTVRLLDVEPTDDCAWTEPGTRPFELIRDKRSIWLERDSVTEEADGTWPRYLWTQNPEERSNLSYMALWNAAQCAPDTANYAYVPEDGMDRNEVRFLEAVRSGTDEDDAEAQAAREQAEKWAKRKAEQEAREKAAQEGAEQADGADPTSK